jgi:hypothetical protein
MSASWSDDVDLRRRSLLKAAPLGLLASCMPAASPSFSARFEVAGTGTIALDYADEHNFAFTPALGWGATRIVDGRIHLVITPSLATAGRERVIWAGELGALPDTAEAVTTAIPLQPSAVSADAQRIWRLDGAARDVRLPASGADAAATVLTVGHLPSLARAQYVIDTRMRPGMDMSLCGDGVNRLVAAWAAALTRDGLAVLASTAGVRLASRLMPLHRRPALPSGIAVEDFRVALQKQA